MLWFGSKCKKRTKKNSDIAGQEDSSSADLASTMDDPINRIESKIDILVNSVRLLLEVGQVFRYSTIYYSMKL